MSNVKCQMSNKSPMSKIGNLTHSATSPNACHWGIRAVPPKAEKNLKGLSLSVSILKIPRIEREFIENKPQCLSLGYTNVLTYQYALVKYMGVFPLEGR